MRKQVELLAPVGSMEALYAAVENGANAVYLGGKLFNARHYASNFDYEELRDALNYAHINDVRVYITVNILIDNEEIEDILDYIRFLYEIDVDAIIVQDLGLASLVRKVFPDLAIHGSTQMTINNLWGAKYLEELGFTRVVLARETPIDEIKHIRENTSIELEGFIHGALCVSYSGQCFMSSMIGGRSGNRGRCAQPCRMNYSIVKEDGSLVKDWDKKYILSTRDLNTIDQIDEIIDAGISSLKIEGRMKRPEYVATIVNNYRRAIDQGLEFISKKDREDMGQIFNRNFTKGLGLGDFGRTYISTDRPDNRGILLGRVLRADKYKLTILLEEDLEKDDGIEFILANGQYKGIKSPVSGKKGSKIIIDKPGYINNDSLVYRTSSQKLLEEAKLSYMEKKPRHKIDMEVTIKIGQSPILVLRHKDYNIVISLDSKVEKARKSGLDKERLREQLEKLGDTVYQLENISFDLDEGAFLPLSAINQLRREATEKLDTILENKNHRSPMEDMNYEKAKREAIGLRARKEYQRDIKLHVRVDSLEQFKALDLDKLDRVYLGFTQDIENQIDKLRANGKEAYLWTEKILYKGQMEKLKNLLDRIGGKIQGLSVANLGTYKFIKDNYDLKIHGDIGLNIFNSYTSRHLREEGLDSLSLSEELNLKQVKEIARSQDKLEALVYGYSEVMTMKTCPMALVKGCKDDSQCSSCNFARGYGLKDRMNMTFYMNRGDGFTTIYNSVPLLVLDNIDRIIEANVASLRLDFTIERENIREIQTSYYDYIHGLIDEEQVKDFIDKIKEKVNISNGHYFRGII